MLILQIPHRSRRAGVLFVIAVLAASWFLMLAPSRASALISPLGTYENCQGTCGCQPKTQAPVVAESSVINECGQSSAASINGNVVTAFAWGESATLSTDGSVLAWQDGSNWVRAPQGCGAQLPSDSDAALLARLLFAEATRASKANTISNENSRKEMAAIAYTAINRSAYLTSHPTVRTVLFKAKGRSLSDVIFGEKQYGGVNSPHFEKAGNPDQIDVSNVLGRRECNFLQQSADVAAGALGGVITDPFAAQGGVYGMRTAGHGTPGNNFYPLPQIPGSNNTFFGLNP